MLKIATILHPTDFSPVSDQAFQLAYALARDHGGMLIVAHVAEPPVVGYGQVMTPPPEGDWSALEEQLHAIKALDDKVAVAHRLEEGSPASEILRLAEEIHCDLIVMGSHGRGPLARLLIGNVAEQVMRKATCPVLVVTSSMSSEAAANVEIASARS